MGLDPEFDEYEQGDPCPHCHEDLFHGHTPKYVELTLAGLVACPAATEPPPNGVWLLPQVLPCEWYLVCEPYIFHWFLGEGFSTVNVWWFPRQRYFYREYLTWCVDEYTNADTECSPSIFSIGGTAKLRWGPSIGPQSSFIGWEVGDSCCICESRIFSGFTPLHVDAWVRGIRRCPAVPWAPPSGHYLLTQIANCTWELITDVYIFTWSLQGPGATFEILEVPGGHTWFHRTGNRACAWFFEGQLAADCFDVNVWGWLGMIDVTWGPHVVP